MARSARSTGPGKLLIAVYAIFALSATARSLTQIIMQFSQAPVAYLLSAFAGVVYIVATIALATPGRRAYVVSWVTISIEFIGVVAVGTLTIADSSLFPSATVWSEFGAGYGFVPLVLPLLGMLWLWRNRSELTDTTPRQPTDLRETAESKDSVG